MERSSASSRTSSGSVGQSDYDSDPALVHSFLHDTHWWEKTPRIIPFDPDRISKIVARQSVSRSARQRCVH